MAVVSSTKISFSISDSASHATMNAIFMPKGVDFHLCVEIDFDKVHAVANGTSQNSISIKAEWIENLSYYLHFFVLHSNRNTCLFKIMSIFESILVTCFKTKPHNERNYSLESKFLEK